jgi:hypothetical protein
MQVRGTGWVKLWCPKRPAADHSKHRKQNATPSGVGRRSQEKTAIAIVTKIPAMVWLVSRTIPIDRSLMSGEARTIARLLLCYFRGWLVIFTGITITPTMRVGFPEFTKIGKKDFPFFRLQGPTDEFSHVSQSGLGT